MNIVERAIRETTAEPPPEIAMAAVGLGMLGLADVGPVFLVEMCVGYLVGVVNQLLPRAFVR